MVDMGNHRAFCSVLPKCLITALLLCMLQQAVAREYLCRYVGITEGLSQSYVTSMTRDCRGFLWVGTRFGLNRYDFNHFVNYYHAADNPSSIPDNHIRSLYTDRHGRVWVACERGAAVYNDQSNDFTVIKHNGTPVNVRSFYDDGRGLILGGAGKLFYIADGGLNVTQLPIRGGSTMYYTRIMKYDDRRLMLVTRWDGIWLYDTHSQKVIRMPGIDDKGIMAATLDSKGDLWVSPYGRGVYHYNSAGRCLDSLKKSNSSLTNEIILDLMVHKGQIWMSSDGGGVCVYDPVRRVFDTTSLAAPKSVRVLYCDRHDNLYAGTIRDGFMTIRQAAMKTYQNNPEDGTSVSAILSVCRDSDGSTLWLGADGDGVLRMTAGKRLQNIPSTEGMKVMDVVNFDDNTLLLTSYNRGFCLLDKRTLELRSAPEPLNRKYRESSARSLAVHIRDLGAGNIALINDRISVYHLSSNTITESSADPGAVLLPIYSNGSQMICYSENLICEYDLSTDSYRRLITTRRGERIVCACYDGSGSLYFSNGTKLRKYDFKTRRIHNIELNISRISSMAVDGEYLWIGSNRSIYLRDMRLDKLLEFGQSDGVAPNEYLPNASLLTPEALYMGGVTGLLRIDRGDISQLLSNEAPLTLNIADLIIDGRSAAAMVSDGSADIAPGHTTVRLQLIADGGNYLQRQPIRYHIVGGDMDRVFESSDHSIDLSMLKDGQSYDILASTTLPNGSWSSERKLLTMNMLTPWYTSRWFIISAIILFIMGALWLDRQRRRRHSRRMERHLEEYRNRSLEKEIAFLVNTNYALRTPLTLIYAPVKHLIEQFSGSERDAGLNELKMVYANVKKMRDAIDMAMQLHNVGFEKGDIDLGRHNLRKLLDKVVESRQDEADLKRISISVEAPGENVYARCDPKRMSIILATFIDNALHRSTENGVIRIVLCYGDSSHSLIRVVISDNGQSLGDDQLSVLFSKYSTDSSATFGNALAFAYAETMAQAQNGSVGAANNRDLPGLNVWVDIPVDIPEKQSVRTSADSVASIPSESTIADTDTSGMTALVVEDDKDLCMFITASLAPHFGRILHAFNGKNAWLLVQQHQPDIVISSLMLSAKSGLELCQAIKARPETSHIPVILLSAFKDDPELERGYSAGADSYISKPFDINVLLTRCRSLLHNRTVLRRRYESSAYSSSRLGLSNAAESFLMSVDKIIEENIGNVDFGVDTLITRLSMSRSALYARFKEVTGVTIGSYISEYRLRRARQLLADRSLSVYDISERLGFSSQRYFSTFFKEHTGQSPTEYRRQL